MSLNLGAGKRGKSKDAPVAPCTKVESRLHRPRFDSNPQFFAACDSLSVSFLSIFGHHSPNKGIKVQKKKKAIRRNQAK